MTEEKILNRNYISLFCINVMVSMSLYMLSTTISKYAIDEVMLTPTVAGTIVGTLSIASLVMRPFTGVISDRFNRKRLLIGSMLLISLAMFGCSMTGSVPLLIAFRILHGIAFSMSTTITMALVAGSLPREKMTQGLAYFAIGQTFSSAIAPTIGLSLGESAGFRTTFRLAAGLILGAALLALLLVKSEPAVRKNRRSVNLGDIFAPEALPFALLAILVSGFTALENSFISKLGDTLSLGSIGWYFTVGAVALFVARAFCGRLADRSRAAIPFSLGMMALAFLLIGLVTGRVSAGIATVVLGLAALLKALGLGIAQPALQARSVQSVAPERRGVASCTYYLGTDIGQAFFPIIGGALVSAGGYNTMFALSAIPMVLATGVLILLDRKTKRSAES